MNDPLFYAIGKPKGLNIENPMTNGSYHLFFTYSRSCLTA